MDQNCPIDGGDKFDTCLYKNNKKGILLRTQSIAQQLGNTQRVHEGENVGKGHTRKGVEPAWTELPLDRGNAGNNQHPNGNITQSHRTIPTATVRGTENAVSGKSGTPSRISGEGEVI